MTWFMHSVGMILFYKVVKSQLKSVWRSSGDRTGRLSYGNYKKPINQDDCKIYLDLFTALTVTKQNTIDYLLLFGGEKVGVMHERDNDIQLWCLIPCQQMLNMAFLILALILCQSINIQNRCLFHIISVRTQIWVFVQKWKSIRYHC